MSSFRLCFCFLIKPTEIDSVCFQVHCLSVCLWNLQFLWCVWVLQTDLSHLRPLSCPIPNPIDGFAWPQDFPCGTTWAPPQARLSLSALQFWGSLGQISGAKVKTHINLCPFCTVSSARDLVLLSWICHRCHLHSPWTQMCILCFSPPTCSSARLNQVSIWIGDLPGEFTYSRKHSSLTETYFSITGASLEPSGSGHDDP